MMGVATVKGGGAFNCALKTDGSIACWGYNIDGELGDGTRIDKVTPVAVLGGAIFWK